jgi:conjugal transfer pilus assembly protein TraI
MINLKGKFAGFVGRLLGDRLPATPSKKKIINLESSKAMIDSIAYPPRADGVEIHTVEVICAAQNDLLKLCKFELGLIDPMQLGFNESVLNHKTRIFNYQTLVLSVVEKFIGYAHLLPASENHHHAAVGGLVRHSLEVSLYSLRHLTKLELPAVRFPDELISKRARWEYAAWITGLAHDLGKPLFDMKVIAPSGLVWNPNSQDIYTWQNDNQVEKYQVEWRHTSRHGKHTGLAAIILERILTSEAKRFLFDGSDDLQIMMQEALSGIDNGHNPILQSLKKGEARSVHNDMKWQWDRLTGGRKQTLEAAFVKKLTMIRREWKINVLNESKIWVIGQDAFVTYPGAIQLIMDELRSDGWSVPSQATIMTEMLLERRLVEPIIENYNTGYFMPDGCSGRPDRLIKLKWAGMLFEDEIIPRGSSGRIEVTKDGYKGVIYHPNSTVEEFDITPTAQPEVESVEPKEVESPAEQAVKGKLANKSPEAKSTNKPAKVTSKSSLQKTTGKNGATKSEKDEGSHPEKKDAFKGIVFANAKPPAEVNVDPTSKGVAIQSDDITAKSQTQDSVVNDASPKVKAVKPKAGKSEVTAGGEASLKKSISNIPVSDSHEPPPQVGSNLASDVEVSAVKPNDQDNTLSNDKPNRQNLFTSIAGGITDNLITSFVEGVESGDLLVGRDFTLLDKSLNLPNEIANSLVREIGDEIHRLKNDGLLILNPKTPRKTTEKVKFGNDFKWCYRIKFNPELTELFGQVKNPESKSKKTNAVTPSISAKPLDSNMSLSTDLDFEESPKPLIGTDEVTMFMSWMQVQGEPLSIINDRGDKLFNLKECLSKYVDSQRKGAPLLELKKAVGKATQSLERIEGTPWLLINFEGFKNEQ